MPSGGPKRQCVLPSDSLELGAGVNKAGPLEGSCAPSPRSCGATPVTRKGGLGRATLGQDRHGRRTGRVIPPQPRAPCRAREAHTRQGHPAHLGMTPAPAQRGMQGTVGPLAGNRWQQILIAFIIIIFLCMCAQEIYRQLRRQNQLFML